MTQHSEQIGELVMALAKAMGAVENPGRDREVTVTTNAGAKYRFKYATLGAIVDSVRKPLSENGLWFTQIISIGESNTYTLTTKLLHSSGQWLATETPIHVQGTGNQQFGSALTYMKRYSLCALLGVVADEDDDGNTGDGHEAEIKPRTAQRPAQVPSPGSEPSEPRPSDEQLPDAITAAEVDLERNGILTAEQIVKARLKHGGGASVEKMTGIGRRSYLSKLKEQLKVN